MDSINWGTCTAAVWRPNQSRLKAISVVDPIKLDDLIGVDRQKDALLQNTARFISKQPFNNALLWGARGTGKSSLIKAIFNHFHDQGLRIIEIFKDDFRHLHDIVDMIRGEPYHFVLYCDDFSFSADDHSYNNLKSVLEGSLEAAPNNVVLYVTSNRRHLVPQTMQDNLDSSVINGELHYSDAIEEKISLSDRFGLWLSFHPISQQQFLEIVDHYFPNTEDRTQLHEAALAFSKQRASRSGRTAKQFFNSYSSSKVKLNN